jgi:16S rRNA (cytosine1402-N4)-methyltransferase
LIGKITPLKLSTLLTENSDEPHADRIAAAILSGPVTTTVQLAAAVRRGGGDDDSVRRVFQALRIAVNDEFGALEALLRNLPRCLKPGGRVAILTFHSGEDRRVKKSFQALLRDGVYSAVAQVVIRASPEERRTNPRSSSAKLRWARMGGNGL